MKIQCSASLPVCDYAALGVNSVHVSIVHMGTREHTAAPQHALHFDATGLQFAKWSYSPCYSPCVASPARKLTGQA